MKSKATLLAILFVIGCGILFSASGWMKQSRSYDSQTNERPEVIVKQRPGQPLEIVTIKLDGVTPKTPEIEFIVANKSFQPIIAYAIRYDTVFKSSKAGGNLLVNAPSMSKALQPGQEATGNLGDGVTYSDPIRKIYLYVDYVQLADGSEWGPDISKASENLAGQRAGAREIASQMRNLLKKNDTASLMSLVDQEGFDPAPPPNATPKWILGFRSGIAIFKDRLRQAYQKKGTDDLEIELNKPFDASGNMR